MHGRDRDCNFAGEADILPSKLTVGRSNVIKAQNQNVLTVQSMVDILETPLITIVWRRLNDRVKCTKLISPWSKSPEWNLQTKFISRVLQSKGSASQFWGKETMMQTKKMWDDPMLWSVSFQIETCATDWSHKFVEQSPHRTFCFFGMIFTQCVIICQLITHLLHFNVCDVVSCLKTIEQIPS